MKRSVSSPRRFSGSSYWPIVGLIFGVGTGMVQAATSYDVLINHETYVTDGSASGQSGDNGPVGGGVHLPSKGQNQWSDGLPRQCATN